MPRRGGVWGEEKSYYGKLPVMERVVKKERERERETTLPTKSLCLRQPLFPTSSRGLFRVKWPRAGVPFSVIKKQVELLALSST